MDSVNVLVRAHYLPPFSRLSPYPTEVLDRMAYKSPRDLFEYWGMRLRCFPSRPSRCFAGAWSRPTREPGSDVLHVFEVGSDRTLQYLTAS
jgi:uncharacterized protein YcaQ